MSPPVFSLVLISAYIVGCAGCVGGSGTLLGGGGQPPPPVERNECVGLVINEVRSSAGDPIELVNTTSERLPVGGCRLFDEGGNTFRFPETWVIEPGGFRHLIKDVDHTFGLGSVDGLELRSAGNEVIDQTSWVDGAASISWCRFPDGLGPWGRCARASFGGANVLEFPALVVEPLFVAGLDDFDTPGIEVEEPNELAFDRNGNTWAGDQFNFRMQVFGPDGAFLRSVGQEGTGPGEFVNRGAGQMGPEAIRVDDQNRVFAADRGGSKVNVYDGDDFSFLYSFGDSNWVDLTGLALSEDGTVYLGDQGTDAIEAWTSDGQYLFSFQTEGVFSRVEALAVDDSRGLLFATNEDYGMVETFDLVTGAWLDKQVSESSTGGDPKPGQVADVVEGIIIDTVNDWLFLQDEQNQRVNVHDIGAGDALYDASLDYAFLGSFGVGGDDPGEFLSADGVAVDAYQDLLGIADQGNGRIQVFRLSDIVKALEL